MSIFTISTVQLRLYVRKLRRLMRPPSLLDRWQAKRAGRRDGRLGVDVEKSSYRQELARRANMMAAKVSAIFQPVWHKLAALRTTCDDRIAEIVAKISEIARAAVNDPLIHPKVPKPIYRIVAAVTVVTEFLLSFVAFRYAKIPPLFVPILAAAFAIGLIALAHLIGVELRSAVQSRLLSSGIVVFFCSLFALILIFGVNSLRRNAAERAIKFQDRADQAEIEPEWRHQENDQLGQFFAEISLALFIGAAFSAFESEYGGARFGLAGNEEKLWRIKAIVFLVVEAQETVRGVKDSVESAIKARFERLELIYVRQVERAIAKQRRAEDRRQRREARREMRHKRRAERFATRARFREARTSLRQHKRASRRNFLLELIRAARWEPSKARPEVSSEAGNSGDIKGEAAGKHVTPGSVNGAVDGRPSDGDQA